MSQTKYIGVLGLGEETTHFYLKKLNKLYHKRFGEYSTCPIKMLQVDFNEINPHLPFEFETLKPIVLRYLIELNSLGVDLIVVPNMTLHLAIDQLDLPNEIEKKLVHPFDVFKQMMGEITVFGTKYTMGEDFFKQSLNASDVIIKAPKKEDLDIIENLRNQVYEHGATNDLKSVFNTLVFSYSEQVLVACTELSLLNEQKLGTDLVLNHIKSVFNKLY